MPTLAEQLRETSPSSILVRKARRLGLADLDAAMQLAAARGCRHYLPAQPIAIPDPGRLKLPDAELTILLLSGENPYHPTAIRCAAQLARSPHTDPENLAQLAARYKTQRVLSHIARAGLAHDPEGRSFWQSVLHHLPPVPDRQEPDLPHWTRFVSMPGRQRHGPVPPQWLVPQS
jgi:hypothetical protein